MRQRFLVIFVFISIIIAAAAGAQAPSSKPSSRPSPRERWNSFSETERDKLRKVFDEYKNMTPEEQAKMRDRAKMVSRERDQIEEKLPEHERALLESLGKDIKDKWLRGAVVELLRSRHRGITSLVLKERFEEILKLPADKREEEMKKITNDAASLVLEKTIEWAMKFNVMNEEEAKRLRSLSMNDAMREVFEIRKKLILDDMEKRPERRASLGDPDIAEMRAMTPERFFEKLEAMRMIPRSFHGYPKENNKDSKDSSNSMFGPPRGHDHDHDFGRDRSRDRSRFMNDVRKLAKETLIKRGSTAEDAEKEINNSSPTKLMELLGKDRPGSKRESRPTSRRGV